MCASLQLRTGPLLHPLCSAPHLLAAPQLLEGQLQKLSELVREHAEDVDRLVRIVAEDRDVIRRQLLRKHHEKVRVRKHLRDTDSRNGLDS